MKTAHVVAISVLDKLELLGEFNFKFCLEIGSKRVFYYRV